MRRLERGGDVGARAEAGVDEAARTQLVERIGVNRAAQRLDEHGLIPFEAEPDQVLIDAVDVLGAAARWVEVFDPQQEFAAGITRTRMAEHRAVGVAQIKYPVGEGAKRVTITPCPP